MTSAALSSLSRQAAGRAKMRALWGEKHPMKNAMVSPDDRALRLANKLRRSVKKKAAKLKAQRPADPEQVEREERARLAVRAVSWHLKDEIATLETRRAAFLRVVEQLWRDSRL
jgi:hypothetical protein